MGLIKWRPSNGESFSDVDWFFDEEVLSPLSNFGWDLAVDVYEKNGDVVAQMNLPGIDPEEVDVSVEGDFLRIAGAREESKEKQEKRYHNKEIRRGSFERVVRLPAPVQRDKISADYKNGALTVTLPKSQEAEASKKIKIQVHK